MPPISPCGMAVDWLRSCHVGAWRFYAERLDVVTMGRFYFVDDRAPFLPFPHDFGSATWRVGDLEPPIVTGEIRDAARPWSNGRWAIPFPPAVPVGTEAEFSGTLPYPFAEPDRFSVMGVDSRCWTNVGALFVGWNEICALDSCCWQLAFARLIELAYFEDAGRLDAFFTTWLGPQAVVTMFPGAGVIPGHCVVVHPNASIVVSSGTASAQQLALQAFQTLTGPLPQGLYASLPLWQSFANLIAQELVDLGANHTAPILLVGHSYGGCACSLAAARMRAAQPDRDICLATYGMPKPGDARLHALLDQTEQIHIGNDDDLVTALPPNALELAPFLALIGALIYLSWSAWRSPAVRWELDVNGNGRWTPPRFLDSEILLPMILNVLGGQPINPIPEHYIEEYIRRLRVQCPEPCWPMTPALWQILFAPNALALAPIRIPDANLALYANADATKIAAELALAGQAPPAGQLVLDGDLPPAGQLVLDGDLPPAGQLVIHNPAPTTPGTSCPTALAMTLGVPFDWVSSSGSQDWYVIPATSGTQYKAKWSTVPTGSTAATLFSGSCAALTPRGGLNTITTCVNYTPSVNENLYLRVDGPLLGAGSAYGVLFDTGACP